VRQAGSARRRSITGTRGGSVDGATAAGRVGGIELSGRRTIKVRRAD
jgi:hypothetical protein